MSRYLDPKNDLVFKRIFGEHPHLAKSLLNALLPLDSPIETVEYLAAELVPEIPLQKNSVVDVRCKDQNGRQFVVEMQMFWNDNFKQRVVFNASKVYVRQLGKGLNYSALQPVYALSLVNEIFEKDTEEYYHHYKIVHQEQPDKILKGFEFVFVELPKFTPKTFTERKMQALWLKFLNLSEGEFFEFPKEIIENSDTNEALDLLQESSYTNAELETYDKYWDIIRVENTLHEDFWNKGKIQGKIEGIEIGEKIGLDKGEKIGLDKGEKIGLDKGKYIVIDNGIEIGMSLENLSKLTGLSVKEIQNYLDSKKK